MPEQHDPAARPYRSGQPRTNAHWSVAQRLQANRRSIQLTALIIVLFLIDFGWSVATKHQAETDARQATQIAIAHANQQWCDLVNAINISDAHQPPPATQYGRALNQALAQRYISLGCSPAGKAGR